MAYGATKVSLACDHDTAAHSLEPCILHSLPAQAPALPTPCGGCEPPENTCRRGSRCLIRHARSRGSGSGGRSARWHAAGARSTAAGGGGSSGGGGVWHAQAGAAGGGGAASGRPHTLHLPTLHPSGAAPRRPTHPAHQRCGDSKAAHSQPAGRPQPQPVPSAAPGRRLNEGSMAGPAAWMPLH